MPRKANVLTVREVAALKTPGRHAVSPGLYLLISATGARSWATLYTFGNRRREMGLGPAGPGGVSLETARRTVEANRALIAAGKDPLDERAVQKASARRIPTFGELADDLVEEIEGGFRNEKHKAQWRMTLTEYAKPLRSMPVDKIETDDVLAVLRPIWKTKPETASRLRGRIERVLAAAAAKKLRGPGNPAQWRGHLDQLLSKPKKLARGHHAAMPFADAPAFAKRLRDDPATAAQGLLFAILTCARSTETRLATWSEIDFEQAVWTRAAERMKAAREHRVPLCKEALDVLKGMADRFGSDPDKFIFPGGKAEKPLSENAFTALLKRDEIAVTGHGFRSTFRDWAGDATSFPRELAEEALAHRVGDATERAYRRQDALERRRELMAAWGAFLLADRSDVVVPLNRQAAS